MTDDEMKKVQQDLGEADSEAARPDRRKARADTANSGARRRPHGIKPLDDNRFGEVEFDPKGNAVWQWRTEEPRRREEDPTIDLLECLNSDDLTLAGTEEDPLVDGFDPYDHTKKKKKKS